MAALELAWRSPEEKDAGMNRVLGSWVLQVLRKSFNRLPDECLLASMQDFAKQYDSWTQRPGRILKGHLDEMRKRIQRINRQRDWSRWCPSIGTTS